MRNPKALIDSRGIDILGGIAAPMDEISCSELRAKIQASRPMLPHHIKELAAFGHASEDV
jgi:hypothetical protein